MTNQRVDDDLGAVTDTTASTLAAIGNRIRDLRQSRELTLQGLAEVCGLSASMLSLVERGRASPSIGSLIVVANALGVTMSELLTEHPANEEKLVVRRGEHRRIETAEHVVRRVIKEDRVRGVSIALNEYAPRTGAAKTPITHSGYEYGFVLEGKLTVEVDGVPHVLQSGDLISYHSSRRHRIWNHGDRAVRTVWINVDRD